MPLHGLEHALVLTDDLEATTAFYCDVLGLDVGERPGLPFTGVWLYLEGTPCLHVAERASYEAQLAAVGLERPLGPVDHLAFAASDPEALTARLESAGVGAVANDVPEAGMRQLFVTDPNGVRIELNAR